MNKLFIKFILIVTTIVLCIMPIVSFAISSNNVNAMSSIKDIITTSSEATPGEEVEIKVDLNKIEYDSFILTIDSSESKFENINVNDGVDIKESSNEMKITIEKAKISVSSLILTYKISDKAKVNSEVSLNVSIIKLENGNTVEGTEISNTLSIMIKETEATAANTDKDDKKESIDKQNFNKDENNSLNNKSNTIGTNKNLSSNYKQSSNTTSNRMGISKNVEENVYNGSSNNYLKSLVIKGYDISPEFKKTSNTYFLSIDENIDSLSVSAKAESSIAKVNVYGNTNLKTGKNKILITVTAENGDTRTYRIYVTKS